MFCTDWFRFELLVHNGSILRLEAAALPARRVRVVHDRDEQSLPEPVRGLATDVSKATAEVARE
jgi:hypothetical protein